MPGLTAQGFVARRQPEILEALIQRLESESALEGLNFRAGPLHQLVGVLSEELAKVWEASEETWASQYGGAQGLSLDRVAGLTGTLRRAATRSVVAATVNLNAGSTLTAGAVAAVDGNPDAQFRTRETVTNTGGSPANIAVTLESVATGPVAAPSGTLTVIVTPSSGWNSITNAQDAELGRERADDVELAQQRILELGGLGSTTLAAVRAAVARLLADAEIAGAVRAYENVTNAVDAAGRPAKSFEVVIWDGSPPSADDDAVAQAIWNNKPVGIEAVGTGSSGTAVDPDTGQSFSVPFTRASQVQVYLEATVVLAAGAAAGWADEAKAAVAARAQQYTVGETLYASQLSCVLQSLAAIEAVATITVGTAPSPVGASVAVAEDEIVSLDTSDMDITEA